MKPRNSTRRRRLECAAMILPGGDFERCEQSRGAMPLVVVAVPGQGASVRQLQIPLRPLQGLDRRLFVDTENNRFGRADRRKGRPHRRLSPRTRGRCSRTKNWGSKVNIVLAQEAPDILNINVAQGLGQQRTTLVAINPAELPTFRHYRRLYFPLRPIRRLGEFPLGGFMANVATSARS